MNKIEILLKAINQVTGPSKEAARSLDDLGDKADKAKGRFSGLGSVMGGALKAASAVAVAGVVALGAGIASSTLKAADMEQQIQDISAAMGETGDTTGKVGKLIKELGFDPKLKVSATEAADAIEMLVKNGLELEEITGGAAKSTVLLANATGADFADAADIATNAMSLFNIDAKDMAKAVNGITGVTIASQFGINDYKLALSQAGGVASAVGVEFDDFNTAIAAISPSFASGSDAGTSFKTFLQRLAPDTDPAREAMAELGLLAEDGGSKFFTAGGQLKSMGEISQLLNDATRGLSEEQKNLAFQTIFGTDAMRAAFAMSGQTKEGFDALKATMGKTDAEAQAETRMNSLRGSMEVLQGVFETTQLSVGEKFIPVFRTLIDTLTKFLKEHGPAITEWAGAFAAKLGELITKYLPPFLLKIQEWLTKGPQLAEQVATVAANVGNFLKGVMDIIGPLASFLTSSNGLKLALIALGSVMALNVIGTIVSLISTIGTVVSAIGGFALAFNPVTLVIIAVGAAIAGLYIAWRDNMFGIRDIAASAWGKVKEWFDNAKGWLADFPGKLQEFGNNARAKVDDAMNRMKAGFEGGKHLIRGAFDQAVDWLARGRDEKLPPFQQSLFDAGKNAFTRMGMGITSVKETVKGEITRFMDEAKNHGYTYATGAFAGRLYDGARDALGRMVQGFRDNAPTLQRDFQAAVDLAGKFNEKVDPLKNHVYSGMQNVMQRMKDGLREIDLGWNLGDRLNGMINAFNGWKDNFGNHVWGSMKDVGQRVIDGMVEGLWNKMHRVEDFIRNLANRMPQWARDALGIGSPSKVFSDLFEWVPEGMRQGIQRNASAPIEALGALTGELMALPADMFSGGLQNVYETGGATYQNNRNNVYNLNLPSTGRADQPVEQIQGLVRQLSSIYSN